MDGVFRYLSRDLRTVERALVSHLRSPVPLIPVVGKHITLSGGKRIRPAILLLTADACGYRGPRRTVMSVVTEYMHTATLLHDDVVDTGTVRRGKPSANVVFGNSVSVLVGDFLFARASQLMTDDGDIDVLGIYARTLVHLSEGEVLQLMRMRDPGITEDVPHELRLLAHAQIDVFAVKVVEQRRHVRIAVIADGADPGDQRPRQEGVKFLLREST